MSKTKKKKKNHDAQQKILAAQARNEFKRKLQEFCPLIDKNAYQLLSDVDIELMFITRPRPFLATTEDKNVPEELLRFIEKDINLYIDATTIEIYEGGPKITYRQYLFVLNPIQVLVHNSDPERKKLRETFDIIMKDYKIKFAETLVEVFDKGKFIGLMYSDFFTQFYLLTVKTGIIEGSASKRWNNTIVVQTEQPVWKNINVGAGKRLAARVGWGCGKEMLWMTVKPSKLRIKTTDNTPFDVYMQQHAINRFYERIGGKYPEQMNHSMIISFFQLKILPTKGGNFLLEHRIYNFKAGYFLASIHDGVLLIRTFLFITHSGTPEGKKLAEMTGLKKLDQKYFSFDNLRTFANSDILSNEEITEMFIGAGCTDLLELCKMIRTQKDFWEISDRENPLSEKILKYIKDGKQETSDIFEGIDD